MGICRNFLKVGVKYLKVLFGAVVMLQPAWKVTAEMHVYARVATAMAPGECILNYQLIR